MSVFVTYGARGVLLYSKAPFSCASADKSGLRQDLRRRIIVSCDCAMS